MVYMIYQHLKTEISRAYQGRDEAQELRDQANAYRLWLEKLEIDKSIRASLVEPIAAIEEALGEVLGRGN